MLTYFGFATLTFDLKATALPWHFKIDLGVTPLWFSYSPGQKPERKKELYVKKLSINHRITHMFF